MTPNLNDKIWGIRKKKLTLIASRTSHGKSAWALQICHDLARQGKAVWLLSLEMTVVQILERLFCHIHEIDNEQIQRGNFSKYIPEFAQFKADCENMNLVITDCMGKTWKEIDSYVAGLKNKPELVIVDYVQNTRGDSSNSKKDLDDYIVHFREMAIRHDFAGILCSQINRMGQDTEDKQPQLHHLKGSGNLEECPDVIWLLHWEHKHNENKPENEYQVHIAKNRDGRTGYVKMLYQPKYFLFKDYTEMEAQRQNKLNETFESVEELARGN